MFKGSFVALITPFRNGGIDEGAFQQFVAWQVEQGTHGFVPTGTTGEAPTLSHDEQERVIALCAEVANGKVPVVAGTGTNSTAHTIELTRMAKLAGATRHWSSALITTSRRRKASTSISRRCTTRSTCRS